ncbi:MAG: LysR substrate-binding domain-containing protein [Sphingobium sp.]
MSASVIQQFDIFAQLIASGNISVSARALKLPAASVVDAMDRLEEQLGCRLFLMEGSAVTLTDTGRKLVRAMGELSLEAQEKWINSLLDTDMAEQAEEEMPDEEEMASNAAIPPDSAIDEGDAPPPSPSVRETDAAQAEEDETPLPPSPIATPAPIPTAAPSDRPEPVRHIMLASHPAIFSHFQEALLAFEEASPDIGISLRLDSMDAGTVKDLFARNLADIAYFYALEEPAGLASRYAWSERISLFVAKGHPLAKRDSTLAEDLVRVPYVALAPHNMARILAEEALARDGLKTGPALLETDNLYEIMKQVQSQPCYFAAFGSMARDFGKMPGIARLAYAQGLPQVQVRQAVRPELQDDPALLALSEFLFR